MPKKGEHLSPERRAKMIATLAILQKGYPKSAQHRAKLSAAQKGKPKSPERRAKLIAALKAWMASHLIIRSQAFLRAEGAARNVVYRAMKNGRLRRPTTCELADGSCKGKIEAHHFLGYAQEHHLDVQWLCTRHHRLEHFRRR